MNLRAKLCALMLYHVVIFFFSFYQPETFVKVRPRCEAPRRDMVYPMNYTPCSYVRISCLRGNPIAILTGNPWSMMLLLFILIRNDNIHSL